MEVTGRNSNLTDCIRTVSVGLGIDTSAGLSCKLSNLCLLANPPYNVVDLFKVYLFSIVSIAEKLCW